VRRAGSGCLSAATLRQLENLWSVDASFVTSLGAGPGGPTLTIAAQALRIAEQSELLR
jgi:choline dehydrogenase-like flavoprotein